MKTLTESKRGCGFRQPGGLYLMSGRLNNPCGKLPIPLTVCPCCGAGVKPSRSITRISEELLNVIPCRYKEENCQFCPAYKTGAQKFLLWIGEKFYRTPYDFTHETYTKGISRRIPFKPKDLIIGKSWIFLAHRKAIATLETKAPEAEINYTPGIFAAFVVERVEYVVKGNETEKDLARMQNRGITPVKVVPLFEGQQSKIE